MGTLAPQVLYPSRSQESHWPEKSHPFFPPSLKSLLDRALEKTFVQIESKALINEENKQSFQLFLSSRKMRLLRLQTIHQTFLAYFWRLSSRLFKGSKIRLSVGLGLPINLRDVILVKYYCNVSLLPIAKKISCSLRNAHKTEARFNGPNMEP